MLTEHEEALLEALIELLNATDLDFEMAEETKNQRRFRSQARNVLRDVLVTFGGDYVEWAAKLRWMEDGENEPALA
jgi:hypothetical protein